MLKICKQFPSIPRNVEKFSSLPPHLRKHFFSSSNLDLASAEISSSCPSSSKICWLENWNFFIQGVFSPLGHTFPTFIFGLPNYSRNPFSVLIAKWKPQDLILKTGKIDQKNIFVCNKNISSFKSVEKLNKIFQKSIKYWFKNQTRQLIIFSQLKLSKIFLRKFKPQTRTLNNNYKELIN